MEGMATGRMDGKVCLVSGATAGIGRATARRLVELGAQVVVVGRDEARLAETVAEIRTARGPDSGGHGPGAPGAPGDVESLRADLSSQAAIRDLARAFASRHGRLDVLVNNVGACFPERRESVDGIEMTWALNHLGYFLLTAELFPSLAAAPAARVVVVSSGAHRRGRIDFADPEGAERYHYWRAYRQSKLANLLFTFELGRRLEGSSITTNALHPGIVATGFARNMVLGWAKRALIGVLSVDVERGAETGVMLASDPGLAGTSGAYFVDGRRRDPARAALDRESARRLWELSERRCGTRFGPRAR